MRGGHRGPRDRVVPAQVEVTSTPGAATSTSALAFEKLARSIGRVRRPQPRRRSGRPPVVERPVAADLAADVKALGECVDGTVAGARAPIADRGSLPLPTRSNPQPDRARRANRPRPPQGRRPRPRARLLLRRARLRADAALRRRRPPSSRPAAITTTSASTPGRAGAARRRRPAQPASFTPRSSTRPARDLADALRRLIDGGDPARRRLRPRRQRGALPARPRRQRRRALLGPARGASGRATATGGLAMFTAPPRPAATSLAELDR